MPPASRDESQPDSGEASDLDRHPPCWPLLSSTLTISGRRENLSHPWTVPDEPSLLLSSLTIGQVPSDQFEMTVYVMADEGW